MSGQMELKISHASLESPQTGPGWRYFRIGLFIERRDGQDPSLEDLQAALRVFMAKTIEASRAEAPPAPPPRPRLGLVTEDT